MALTKERIAELTELCRVFRIDTLKSIQAIQSGHPGGSLSVCEILTLLYQEKMNVSPETAEDKNRDLLVLSKGHAAPMLYRNLIEKGFLPKNSMDSLRRIDSILQGHPSNHCPGVEIPSGPLGIGLSAAQGMALGRRLDGSNARVYAILGDGELNEGCIWEAVMSAPKFKLDNLCVIVDYNKVQLDGTTDQIMPLLDLSAKFKAFGWNVIECENGNDIEKLDKAFDEAESFKGLPSVIIANTIKGKGVSFMEGQASWHGSPIPMEKLELALKELGGEN
ncbi:transketolase [Clostridiaceae bacterium OttesenSCG-928-D20]|nr:transketolase [Clostridiaceae bacterium OttesenSCG-928-D20]